VLIREKLAVSWLLSSIAVNIVSFDPQLKTVSQPFPLKSPTLQGLQITVFPKLI
jgi:hypothetical protein